MKRILGSLVVVAAFCSAPAFAETPAERDTHSYDYVSTVSTPHTSQPSDQGGYGEQRWEHHEGTEERHEGWKHHKKGMCHPPHHCKDHGEHHHHHEHGDGHEHHHHHHHHDHKDNKPKEQPKAPPAN